MDTKDAQQAKLKILAAADWWARNVMRLDKQLSPVEQTLFDAVIYYQRFPKPPNIPRELHYKSRESQIPTKRYSDIPTRPSPPFGIPAIDVEQIDHIDELKHINELYKEDLWTGKKTGR
jgi:hypothetical protein